MTDQNFFEKVYAVTQLIPVGRVTSYGAIASYLGSPQSARMVGWALNTTKRCPQWVPAHRVVNRNGILTGKMHFPGSETMCELLESEGIIIENDKIQSFDDVFWDPNRELEP